MSRLEFQSPEQARSTDLEVVEIIITRKGMRISADEFDAEEVGVSLDVNSLSVRGAQREVTAEKLAAGFRPLGRWETLAEDGDDYVETARLFGRKH